MVARARGRRGGSTAGCLIWLAVFAAAVYYGVQIGQVYVRHYRLLDAMRFQAQMAPTIKDDNLIARRLTAAADSILGKSPRFRVARTAKRITIQTEYSDRVELPLFKRTFHFRPRAEAPL
jgi:hypothetical protein